MTMRLSSCRGKRKGRKCYEGFIICWKGKGKRQTAYLIQKGRQELVNDGEKGKGG